jgi:hypothetical protein
MLPLVFGKLMGSCQLLVMPIEKEDKPEACASLTAKRARAHNKMSVSVLEDRSPLMSVGSTPINRQPIVPVKIVWLTNQVLLDQTSDA